MSQVTSSNNAGSNRDIVYEYRSHDPGQLKHMQALILDPHDMVLTIPPDLYGIKSKEQKILNTQQGQWIYGINHYTLNEGLLTSRKLYESQTNDDKELIDQYIHDFRNGVCNIKGVRYGNNESMYTNWQAWWAYLDRDAAHEMLRFAGSVDSKEEPIRIEYLEQRTSEQSFDTMVQAYKKRTVQSIPSVKLHKRGTEWIRNPVMCGWIEDEEDKKTRSPYGSYISGTRSDFGLHLFEMGYLTAYFVKHDTYGCNYVMCLCEENYGQLFTLTGNPKYSKWQKIGIVVEIQGKNTTNWLRGFIEHKYGKTGEKDDAKYYGVYKTLPLVKIRNHVC